jgi:hypothetical protein
MINGIPEDTQANLAMLDELSGTRTCNRTSPLGADGPGRSRYTHATPVRPSRSSSPPSWQASHLPAGVAFGRCWLRQLSRH